MSVFQPVAYLAKQIQQLTRVPAGKWAVSVKAAASVMLGYDVRLVAPKIVVHYLHNVLMLKFEASLDFITETADSFLVLQTLEDARLLRVSGCSADEKCVPLATFTERLVDYPVSVLLRHSALTPTRS